MVIDSIDADFAANASGALAPWRRYAAFGAAFARRRLGIVGPDKPSRFKYTSASIEPQRVARVA